MVSAGRIARPSRRATSVHAAPTAPDPCVAPSANNPVPVGATLARRLRAWTRRARVPAIQRRTAGFCSSAALRVDDAAVGKGGSDECLPEARDRFCCKKFPTPIAAEKVPHYIRHYRVLINQLTDPHLTECGD
jgi:hypothetical protein